MDSRIAWIQPEQFGPATALWQRLWENSKHLDENENQSNDQNDPQNQGTKVRKAQFYTDLRPAINLAADKTIFCLIQAITEDTIDFILKIFLPKMYGKNCPSGNNISH